MHPMPTQEQLSEAQGSLFQLWIAPEQAVEVELMDVQEGTAMTPKHQCFSAHFALPAGLELPQALYRLASPGEEGWLLLMTPGRPDGRGLNVLQAVFHVDKPA